MEIDSGLVRRLLQAQFPDWAGLPIEPVTPAGWDNRTFRLGDAMAVRLPGAAAYARQVGKEQRWLPVLAPRLPLPIPAPLALGRPGDDYPWPWSVYAWLPGEAASAGGAVDAPRLARSLAGFLVALRRIDPAGGPPPGPHNCHRGGPLATYDSETRRAIRLLGPRIDAGAAVRIWEAALDSPWRGRPAWLHGDISPGNLLVRDGALAAVIDFGCCAVGDPACDLAIAWSWFGREARAAFRSALPPDRAAWSRARGWALWKALAVLAGLSPARPEDVERSRNALARMLAGDGPESGTVR